MTQSFYKPETHLVAALLASPSDLTLHTLFSARVARWPKPMIHGECVTLGLFSDLTSLASVDAFDLIPTGVQIVLDQSADALFVCALELLSELARLTGTTECPDRLTDCWDMLAGRASQIDDATDIWAYISEWYRGGPVA